MRMEKEHRNTPLVHVKEKSDMVQLWAWWRPPAHLRSSCGHISVKMTYLDKKKLRTVSDSQSGNE